MTNLDNKILYLSYTGSHIETTNFKGMGNKIYLLKFEGDRMVFYSFDTKNIIPMEISLEVRKCIIYVNQCISHGLNPCFEVLYDFNY